MTDTNDNEIKVGWPGNPCPDCGCQDGNHASDCSIGGFRATGDSQPVEREPEGLDVLDLRPCLLVAVNVSRRGGQSYQREDEVKLEARKDGEKRTQWTTKKVVDDEEEFKTASSLQSRAKHAAGKLGRHTPIGIVVSTDKRTEVEQYRREWKQKFAEFNSTSRYSKLDFWCMVASVTGDNVRELEAVLDELRDGLADLEQAYRAVDPKGMREVVKRMQGFGDLLPERVATKMELAVKSAQKRANSISRAEKRMTRVQTKIAKELGEEAKPEDVQKELERMSGEVLTADIRKRTVRFMKLNREVCVAADKLEEVKKRIDATPIRLARFAVQRKVQPMDATAEAEAADLAAAQLAGRVALAANKAEVDSTVPATPRRRQLQQLDPSPTDPS